MLGGLFQFLRPALFTLAPEDAHELTLKALEQGLYPACAGSDPAVLQTRALGLTFANPLAIAAGFDKDARVANRVIDLGCGFAEVGTTTPRPQPGNPKPRVFRLTHDEALINRLGFNNKGHSAALANLQRSRPATAPLAVNIGANKDSEDRAGDYVAGLKAFYDVASYFVVNISSPNTPGLRDLQAPDALEALLTRILSARAELMAADKGRRPIVVKIAPDIAEDDLPLIVEKLIGLEVDGIAVSNTTLSRTGLTDRRATEAGGLSGAPLFHRSTVVLARVYELSGGKVPLIGIGGIHDGETALQKIEAGATLLQLYTGLIYQGPGLIQRIKSSLETACDKRELANLSALTGRQAKDWASKPLEVG
jgi:dihydroorotate dehydrogenase